MGGSGYSRLLQRELFVLRQADIYLIIPTDGAGEIWEWHLNTYVSITDIFMNKKLIYFPVCGGVTVAHRTHSRRVVSSIPHTVVTNDICMTIN